MRHHRLGARGARLRLLPRLALGGQRRLQRVDIVGHRRTSSRAAIVTLRRGRDALRITGRVNRSQRQPATSGRQVRTGFRQSIPSSM